MVLADGDFVSIKAHRPPPQHVVTWKKRKHEALAEAAQHQFRYVCRGRQACCLACLLAAWPPTHSLGHDAHTQGRGPHAGGAAGVHDALHGPRAARLPVRWMYVVPAPGGLRPTNLNR